MKNATRTVFISCPFPEFAIPLTQNRTRAYLELDGVGTAPIDRIPPSAALQ